jgi:aminodeoxyfutalosine deaminase
MTKAELHVHLEGSIGPETLLAIDPSLTREEIEANLTCRSFPEFLQGYIWVNKKTYAEITLSAGVVLWKQQDLAAVYEAVWRESQRSRVRVFWILDSIRQFGPEKGMEVARFAVSRREDGVIAYGIGGDEVRGPAHWFSDVFAFARDSGLHLVAHAGETAGPESIWGALSIGAERIGHGIAAAQDPRLMAQLRENNIPLEVCISSNVCTGAVESLAAHPVRALYDAQVPITIHTDDPAFFRTTLTREYELAAQTFGLPAGELARNSFRYAFRAAEITSPSNSS